MLCHVVNWIKYVITLFLALRYTEFVINFGGKYIMKNTSKQMYESIEDYEENCYLFSQSIQRQRIIGGKSYHVRSYFSGGKDFKKAVEKLAVKQTYKKVG